VKEVDASARPEERLPKGQALRYTTLVDLNLENVHDLVPMLLLVVDQYACTSGVPIDM